MEKGPIRIIDKPTDITYKFIDSNKKEIVQHRNNLLSYYPNDNVHCKLTQIYSFTGLKLVHNNSEKIQKQTIGTNRLP